MGLIEAESAAKLFYRFSADATMKTVFCRIDAAFCDCIRLVVIENVLLFSREDDKSHFDLQQSWETPIAQILSSIC